MTFRDRIKSTIKVVAAHTLYLMGVLQVWQRIALRRKAVVLMYHRVLTPDERAMTGSHPGIVVDREDFAAQMAMLKERFRVLSIKEFTDRMERKVPFEDASCLITFDDGWRDNYSHALPILRHHGIPAVIFLPVNFIGGGRLFWQELLTHLTLRAVTQARQSPECRERLSRLLATVGLESTLEAAESDLRVTVVEAVRRQKHVPPTVINSTLTGLAEELGVRWEEYQEADGFLDWGQVSTMAQQGVTFGGHGAEHRILTFVSPSEAQEEIQTAKAVLDSRLSVPAQAFSYPNGNWSPEVAKLVEESGYRVAFTTDPGYVSCDDDRFSIRRVNIHDGLMGSRPMFLARIVGLF
jgi:peptidoglycan/xylan/chitin deacetylase (PgdA/CDA1 family)